MEKKIIGRLLTVVGLLLLGALAAPVWATEEVPGGPPVPVALCGTALPGPGSFYLTADLLVVPGTTCLAPGNGVTINLNGHSIRGDITGAIGTGSVGIGGTNNVTIKGPGIIHDVDTCISLGTYALLENVLVYGCWGTDGITLGHASKCVECRVHNAKTTTEAFGIVMGDGCLLESSIVETSDNGAKVGQDCKVWDLVVDDVLHRGLVVGGGTSVARTVISHYHDGPGLDYTACGAIDPVNGTTLGCQDSSNSVGPNDAGVPGIADGVAPVITDCATNNTSVKYVPTTPPLQCGLGL